MLEIPGAPADVGPDWVNAALGDHDHFQGSRVSGVSSEVIGDGAGFQAQVVRLHLSYERSGQTGPATVVLKLPSTEPRVRQMAVSHGIYGREVGLYRDLAFRGGVPAPACYWCAIDPGPERFGILLPDLGELASED
ncbi:MAG TPA: hypothetical protein VEJ84_10845, partial [Acidimicrobiales bacterium]|nr:hypothetical protein [Acidimicrobiales bacterium]